nr:hypothetical protein [Sphingomonas sp. SCN 67-18]
MDLDNCVSWLEAASPASPASHDEIPDNRGQANRYATAPTSAIAAQPSQILPPDPLAAGPASGKAATGLELLKGTWFDPALDFRDPEGDALATAVLSLITAIESRRRKPKQADARNRYALVRAILANGFRCHYHRRSNRIAYSRRAEGYPNGPGWLNGRAMAHTIDLLEAARLIKTYPGKRGQASTYHIMPGLYGMAQDCGITQHSLTLCLPRERLVRLREGNSDTSYLTFEPTDDTRRWAEQLQAYNAFVRQQNIALALTEEEEAEWVEHWNAERCARKRVVSVKMV